MRIRWFGSVPYRQAWVLQQALCRRTEDDYLVLLEHPHVYTVGTHGSAANLLVAPEQLGAEVVRVDRGGDITYHGPGQLVGYPIVSVGPGPHRGTRHVHQVEQVVIEALVSLGLDPADVGRLDGFPGVWVGLSGTLGASEKVAVAASGPRKICAIGVRTTRGRTMHGFALNVAPELARFSAIVPCGLVGRPVTSLAAEGIVVSMAAVVEAVVSAASTVWGPRTDLQRVTDGAIADPGALTDQQIASRRAAPIAAVEAGRPTPVALGRRATPESALDRRLRRSGVDPDAGLAIGERKPPWLRVQAQIGKEYLGLQRELRQLDLVTVCEEAGCPNIYECWSDGTATFMINGSRCTRACGFCQVDTRRPLPLDPGEPQRVAEEVGRMRLTHAVITCVARDDLPDGGAEAFAATIAAIRRCSPSTAVEVLISDCKGDESSLSTIFGARPDVMNHNIETVARLQRAVRPSAGYARSLAVLARSKDAGLTTKSGIILGMGEREDEVTATLADLRSVGVDIVTMGQYLRPSTRHLPVARWWTPEEFDALRVAGLAMGFSHVQASPLTRSSYHARQAAGSAAAVATPASLGTPASPGTPISLSSR